MSKKQHYLILFGLLFLIFPFFALLMYVHPQSDDYFFAFKMQSMGAFEFVKEMYFNRTGRYASMFIGAFDPLCFRSLLLFRISLFFLAVFFLISLFALLRSVFLAKVKSLSVLIFTLSIFIVFINGILDLYEFLYWFPSVSSYTLGSSLFMLFVANYINYSQNKSSISFLVISNSFLAFITIGLNELFVIPFLLVLGFVLLQKINTRKVFTAEFIIFAVVIILSLVVVLAPGNYVRMKDVSLGEQFVNGIVLSIESAIFTLGHFFQNTSFVLFSLLLFSIMPNYFIQNNYLIFSFPRVKPIYVILATIVLLIALFFPALASLGFIPPGRIFNFVGFFFVIIWIIDLLLFAKYYEYYFKSGIQKKYAIIIIIIAIVFLFSGVFMIDSRKFAKGEDGSVFLNGNILKSYYTLIFRASTFDKEMQEKNIYFEKNKGKKMIDYRPIVNGPELLQHENLNEKEYQNIWYWNWEVKYHGIDSIYIIQEDRSP